MDNFRSGKKSLEYCCYIAGAGAFCVFLRWLQRQLAFDELGLAEKSAFHFFVVGFLIAAAIVFLRFIRGFALQRRTLPEDFAGALCNSEHKLYTAARYAAGGLMLAGALLLLHQSGTDRNASDFRNLSILAGVAGIAFPIWLGLANREDQSNTWLPCLLSFLPMLAMAVWMIICYKLNTINSVIWDFIIELLAVALTMFAFFRLGGFAFGKPDWKRCLFDCSMAATMDLMALADERYLGMQLNYKYHKRVFLPHLI